MLKENSSSCETFVDEASSSARISMCVFSPGANELGVLHDVLSGTHAPPSARIWRSRSPVVARSSICGTTTMRNSVRSVDWLRAQNPAVSVSPGTQRLVAENSGSVRFAVQGPFCAALRPSAFGGAGSTACAAVGVEIVRANTTTMSRPTIFLMIAAPLTSESCSPGGRAPCRAARHRTS